MAPHLDDNGAIVAREEVPVGFFVEDLGEGVGLEMVRIPAGSFEMGSTAAASEQPVHSVALPAFFLGAHEITRGQRRRVRSFPRVAGDLHDLVRLRMPEEVENQFPVDIVIFREAQEFCDRLKLATGRPYRLPSEAEWEYACRAGTRTAYHFGERITLEVANYNGLQRPIELIPVGSKNAPNAFGLHDMHGNVSEWCQDRAHSSYDGAPIDGSAWLAGGDSSQRVLRGGDIFAGPEFARTAARFFWMAGSTFSGFGFRVAIGPCEAGRVGRNGDGDPIGIPGVGRRR
ncbi:MAG: formylglycine-generating enzyme family protein [Candidatus Solibacter usitatus]|nr:formylglycine-generating enzyme family protein [Candidatus Solibacter usitatus]